LAVVRSERGLADCEVRGQEIEKVAGTK
jgi:hypothetical protein